MPKKTSKKFKRRSAPQTPRRGVGDLEGASIAIAQAIGGLGEGLRHLWYIDPMSDYVGELASAVRGLADATALSVIAQRGTDEERAAAVAHLKGWFETFPDVDKVLQPQLANSANPRV